MAYIYGFRMYRRQGNLGNVLRILDKSFREIPLDDSLHGQLVKAFKLLVSDDFKVNTMS